MPRKKSGDVGGPNTVAPAKSRQRKKKETNASNLELKSEIPTMSYEPQGVVNGMSHGMLPDEPAGYGQPSHEYYYQQGGATSTSAGGLHNGYGPTPAQGPSVSSQSMPYHDNESQLPQQQPPAYIHASTASQQHQPGMMPPHPSHTGTAPNSNGNISATNVPPNVPQHQVTAAQSQLMLRQFQMPTIPQPPLLEYRIMEMNKRMYAFYHQGFQLPVSDYGQWWESFSHEFFDDDARMNLILFENPDYPKRYCIGKTLIGRFFRTMFETGVQELSFTFRAPSLEKLAPWGGLILECENVLMMTRIDTPVVAEVNTDARMCLEFSPFDEQWGYRIKGFTLELKNSQEFVAGHVNLADLNETIRQGLTTCGLTTKTVKFLKLGVIMEPMQIVMFHCKTNQNTTPKEALKSILFRLHEKRNNQYNNTQARPPAINHIPAGGAMQPNIAAPPIEEIPKKPPRKRARKNINASNASPSKQRKTNCRSSPTQNTNAYPPNQPYSQQPYQEVLVVGEPSLMGGDFGEEDERSISRIENTQYDASAAMSNTSGSGLPTSAVNTPTPLTTNGSTPMYSRQNSFNRNFENAKMLPAQTPIARVPSSSQLTVLQPPPSYESAMGGSNWNNNIGSNAVSGPPIMTQGMCDQ